MTAVPFDNLTVKFEVSWSTAPFAAPSYTDETANLRSFSLRRGRTSQFDQFTAGTLEIELENSGRRYDPTYASSPLSPNVLPRKKCRLTLTYSAVSYIVFTGFLTGLPQFGEMSNTLGTARLYAADGFSILARAKQPTGDALVGDGETITARMGRLLDYAAWPAADRDIDTNSPTLVHMQEDGSPLLDEIYSAAAGDFGQVFIAGDGKFTYHGRAWQLANNLTASATVGDSTGEIPYTDCVFTYDDTLIFNRVTGSYFIGNETVGFTQLSVDVKDTTSVTAYGESVKPLSTVSVNNTNVMSNTANWVVAYYKDPKLRCTQLTFNPRRSPATMYPVVLAAEVGARWTFIRRPQNVGSAISQDVIVEGVTHTMTVDSFTSTFDLSQAPAGYWQMGSGKWTTGSPSAVWA